MRLLLLLCMRMQLLLCMRMLLLLCDKHRLLLRLVRLVLMGGSCADAGRRIDAAAAAACSVSRRRGWKRPCGRVGG